MSLGTLAIGVAVYQLLAGDDVGYLDLEHPVSNNVLCLTTWPLREEHPMLFFRMEQWEEWVSYRFNEEVFIAGHNCSSPEFSDTRCLDVEIPLKSVGRKLGRPLGIGDTLSYDLLDTYAWLFLLLAGWLWIQVVFHDLSLLASANKNFVLDLNGIKEEFPCVRHVFSLIGCSTLRICCCSCESKTGRVVGFVCVLIWAPVALCWSVLVFLGVAVPMVSLIFLVYPARMSRFGVFLASVACAIYGLILAIHNLVYLSVPDSRAEFAVTWETSAASPCVCGCVYPLAEKIIWQFALVGGVTVAKSVFLAMRCLKGLRRRNWANMLSVTFPVPVNAYAVEWKTADGKPIQFRQESGPLQPVQGELAFDPFAMMDEQPDSMLTLVNLKPIKAKRLMKKRNGKLLEIRKLEGPGLDDDIDEQRMPAEIIGCCGFPYLTGGVMGRFPNLDDASSDGALLAARGPAGATPMASSGINQSLQASMSLNTDLDDENPDFQAQVSPLSDIPPTPTESTPGAASSTDTARRQGSTDLIRVTSGGVPLQRIPEDGSCLVAGAPEEALAGATSGSFAKGEALTEVEVFGSSVGPLGIEVEWQDRLPTIRRVTPGGEAEKRGFRAGDALAELNGQSTQGRQRSELLPVLGQRPLRIRLMPAGWRASAAGGAREVALHSGRERMTSLVPGGPSESTTPAPRPQAANRFEDACFGCAPSLSPMAGMLRATSFGRMLDRQPSTDLG